MRGLVLVVVSALALAACGQNSAEKGGGSQQAENQTFPSLIAASYRAEATITNSDGETSPFIMVRDGRKMRMEGTSDQGQFVVISNGENDEYLMISNGMAIRMRATGTNQAFQNPAALWEQAGTGATFAGPCAGAGQVGSQWSRNNDQGESQTVCVTTDGIILKVTENGRTTWETTSVQRGPQAASLFEAPPGVRVMNLGDMSGAMQQAIERAQKQ